MKTAKAVLGGLALVLMWAVVFVIGYGILYAIIIGAIWVAAHVSVIGWILAIILSLVVVVVIVGISWAAIEEVKEYGFREAIKHSFKEFFRG